MGNPEAMEQFNQSEIGVDPDGWQYFIDGQGTPIAWLRWAPGFSNQSLHRFRLSSGSGPSDIQSGDP